MWRYKLTLQYRGTLYSGWATQPNSLLPSVCSVVEEAVEKFFGVKLSLKVASKTDKGVHALANVAHIDIPISVAQSRTKAPTMSADPLEPALLKGINFHLRGHPIEVIQTEKKGLDWDARSSAVSRSYVYRIMATEDPHAGLIFDSETSWHHRGRLDLAAMQRVCHQFQGTHDFACFGKPSNMYTRTTTRTIDIMRVEESDGAISHLHRSHGASCRLFQVFVQSPAFMYHQVRYMVGALAKVGKGQWSENDIQRMLKEDPKRTPFPPAQLLVPPQGLFLQELTYSERNDPQMSHRNFC